MSLNLQYEPQVLVEDIKKLTREEWKRYRLSGIGGSDVAALCGVSPWATARDLYEEKTKKKYIEWPDSGWVAMEIGSLLEELVVQIFMAKTKLQPYAVRKMFYHPLFSFMRANVDFFVKLNGKIFIVECKTRFSYDMDEWKDGGIPYHYVLQGRHYMCVTNVDGVIFLCLHGNSDKDLIIRRLDRDLEQEEEMIEQECDFWEDHVIPGIPPKYTECSGLMLRSIQQRLGMKEGTQIVLPAELSQNVTSYLELKKKKSELDRQARQIEELIKQTYAPVQEAMDGAETGTIWIEGNRYQAGYTKRTTTSISKDSLEAMQLRNPEIYREYAKTNTSMSFFIKQEKAG